MYRNLRMLFSNNSPDINFKNEKKKNVVEEAAETYRHCCTRGRTSLN